MHTKSLTWAVAVLLSSVAYSRPAPRISFVSPDIALISAESRHVDFDQAVEIPWKECKHIESTWDCTNAFETRYGFPAIHSVVFSEQDYQDARIGVSEFACELLVVRTVSADQAWKSSAGVGFWYEGLPEASGVHWIPKWALVPVAVARMKTGKLATLHQFVGLANCWKGRSAQVKSYRFKPFLRVSRDGGEYWYWDSAVGDYEIRPDAKVIERAREVLE